MDISVKEGMMKRIRLNVTRVLLAGSILACGANIYRDALFLDQEDFDAVAGCLDINLGFDAREIGDLSEIDFDGQHYYLRVDYRDNKYVPSALSPQSWSPCFDEVAEFFDEDQRVKSLGEKLKYASYVFGFGAFVASYLDGKQIYDRQNGRRNREVWTNEERDSILSYRKALMIREFGIKVKIPTLSERECELLHNEELITYHKTRHAEVTRRVDNAFNFSNQNISPKGERRMYVPKDLHPIEIPESAQNNGISL